MRPAREQSGICNSAYFVSTQTSGRRNYFHRDAWAALMTTVLRHYGKTGYELHAYVIMPEHLHILFTPAETLEKAVQLIKGGFSFRVRKELGWVHDVWQQGFTDHRIRDEADWCHHLRYIELNPIKAGLVDNSVLYPWMGFPNRDFPRGLKPANIGSQDVRAEARTLHPETYASRTSARPSHAPKLDDLLGRHTEDATQK